MSCVSVEYMRPICMGWFGEGPTRPVPHHPLAQLLLPWGVGVTEEQTPGSTQC